MIDAAEEVVSSCRDRNRADLERDHIFALGVVKCLEIIGEAASRVGEETRADCPDVPWIQIVGMRNRLVHAYFDIDLEQVWKTVESDLEPLIDSLRRSLDDS
jgi:uncharacterized protein with HEPN domain